MHNDSLVSGVINGHGSELSFTLPLGAIQKVDNLIAPFLAMNGLRDSRTGYRLIFVHSSSLPQPYHFQSPPKFREPGYATHLSHNAKTVYFSVDNPAFVPVIFVRLASHMLRLEALSRGHQFVHAAAVLAANGTTALVGAKRSGKTTVLLTILRRAGRAGQFISNDNLSIKIDPSDKMSCYGWPRSIRVRPDTISLIKLDCQNALRIPLSHHLNDDLILPLSPSKRLLNDALHLYPAELAAFYSSNVTPTAKLTRIVFLDNDGSHATPKLQLLNQQRGASLMRENTFPRIEIPSLEHASFLKLLYQQQLDSALAPSFLNCPVPFYRITNALNDLSQTASLIETLST